MANNHAVDYGADGLADTLAAVAEAPLPVVGSAPTTSRRSRPR
jgi:poly-gamma-glutamate capsule biosynthesis protein CapA/YwtB (metallophosphatase superfamily)